MLNQSDRRSYLTDGCLAPVRILSHERAASDFARWRQAREADVVADWHDNPHLIYGWARDLVTNPVLLEAVATLIGPNILCWESDLFVKDARSRKFVSWHQDATYWGLQPEGVVTAWVALSPSRRESGCLRVIPGSHLSISPHVDTGADDNMLSRGQEIAVAVDENQARLLELDPGEASFHHVLIHHASAPNETDAPRVGIAIRYMSADTEMTQTLGDYATLVRGSDSSGIFWPTPLASADLHPEDLARHRTVNAHRLRLTMPA